MIDNDAFTVPAREALDRAMALAARHKNSLVLTTHVLQAIAEEREGQRLLVEMGVDVLKLQAALDAHHPASTPSLRPYPITNGNTLVRALNKVVKRVSPKLVTFADLLWCVIECPDGDAGTKVKEAKSMWGEAAEKEAVEEETVKPDVNTCVKPVIEINEHEKAYWRIMCGSQRLGGIIEKVCTCVTGAAPILYRVWMSVELFSTIQDEKTFTTFEEAKAFALTRADKLLGVLKLETTKEST